ncbi:MAG: B12-binding domain-containing radical SAM protein [Vulcanimicrobiota bacterium]
MKVDNILKNMKKLDVLLIHWDLFYGMNYTNINIGLKYIATYLENNDYRVAIMGTRDLYRKSRSELRWLIKRQKPSIIGFYTISDNYELVRDTIKLVKIAHPSAWLVAGGPLATALGKQMLEENPELDSIITGEGEIATKILADVIIRKTGNLKDVPGLVYRKENAIHTGSEPQLIEDLDSLPYPAGKFSSCQSAFQIVSGRGCPYKCTFCFQAGHGLKYRFRSAQSVLDEIRINLETLNVVGFDFSDDAFVIDPGRCGEIARGLIDYREKTKRDFIFFCQGRVNILDRNLELIGLLTQAGMARMQIGIESGNPETLKHYKKQITLNQVRNVVSHFKKQGKSLIVGGFILGGPFESEKTFEDTLNLAIELIKTAPGIFETSMGFLGAYPGTEIAENPNKFGLTMVEPDFAKGHSLSDVQFVTEHLDRNDLRMLNRLFKNRTNQALMESLPRIPEKLIRYHLKLARRYQMYTQLYSLCLSGLTILEDYFNYIDSGKFRKFDDIPESERDAWYPVRVSEPRTYTEKGDIILPASVSSATLTKPGEILAYELSAGKIKIKDIVSRLKKEQMQEMEESNIKEKFLYPFFRRLEKTYHMVFTPFARYFIY